MGAFPGARLVYGVDLGDEYGDMPEAWEDLEDPEEYIKAVDPALTLEYTGDLYKGGVRYILARHCLTVSAYEAPTITAETLLVADGARAVLQAAFRELFPDRNIPEPRWMITVHYG